MSECKSCWWQEGGRCYFGEFERSPDGRSEKLASRRCLLFESKRSALGAVIPNDKLVIASERKGK